MTHQRPLSAAGATRPNPMPASSRFAGALQLNSIDVIVQNPLDGLARLALAEGFDRERIGENDLHMGLPGRWCNHHVSFTWKEDEGLLQLYLVFETRIPAEQAGGIRDLISKLNARMTLGHFDYWDGDAVLVYRQTTCLSGHARLNTAQAMTLIAAATEAAEKAYPAMHYVLWADKTPDEAIEQALFDMAVRADARDA